MATGKIDAAVADLLPDVGSPALSFSDPLLFWEDSPNVFHRWSELVNVKDREALMGAASLVGCPALGQSIALTRPLRDIYLRHKEIVRANVKAHSIWMYQLANATGICRALRDVPSTLYRQHGHNAMSRYYSRSRGFGRFLALWRNQHALRAMFAQHARAFMLAAPTLPPGVKLDRMLALAPLVATFKRRQPLSTLFQLRRHGALVFSSSLLMWLLASCIFCKAKNEAVISTQA